jgi:hypothetical protein
MPLKWYLLQTDQICSMREHELQLQVRPFTEPLLTHSERRAQALMPQCVFLTA